MSKIRILLINNELRYTCGVSNHMFDLAVALREYCDADVFFATGGGDAVPRYTDQGFPVMVHAQFRHSERSFKNFFTGVLSLFRQITKQRIDIVHAHTHYHANMAYWASRVLRVPAVQTNHGINYVHGILPQLKADYFIAVNRHIADYWESQQYPHAAQYSFIRGGIRSTGAERMTKPNELRIICASRLIEEKGIDIFIEAVHLLEEKYLKHCEFLIAGEGELEGVLKKKNESLGGRIRFLGNIQQLEQYFYSTDILVFPSRSKSEGFPRIITEAATAGNLILASKFIGHRYELDGINNSFLFEENDAPGLKTVLEFVLNNSSEANRRRTLGKKHFSEMFSSQRMALETMRIYTMLKEKR